MRDSLKMQMEALEQARTARRRLAVAWQEFKLAWEACENAGWNAAVRCGHDEAEDFFTGVRFDSMRLGSLRQAEVDSMAKALSMLVDEGARAVTASASASAVPAGRVQ